MSALPPKADMFSIEMNVGFVPQADIPPRLKSRKPLSKPDPNKLTLSEIMAAIDQLFVREKYTGLYGAQTRQRAEGISRT